MKYFIKFGQIEEPYLAGQAMDAIDTNYPLHDNDRIDYLVDTILDWIGYIEVEDRYYEFNTLEELWTEIFDLSDVHLDEGGKLHNEKGPAIKFNVNPANPNNGVWYWHGKEGLENFPDEALAEVGDQVI
jgi:hypothetical protein